MASWWRAGEVARAKATGKLAGGIAWDCGLLGLWRWDVGLGRSGVGGLVGVGMVVICVSWHRDERLAFSFHWAVRALKELLL